MERILRAARRGITDRRYAAWAAGLALVAALPILAGYTTLSWEIAEWLGLAAALMCVALCGCPVRPRESTPPALLTLGRHELFGWIALAMATLHVLCAIASDGTAIAYLMPTAPLYQLAGMGALTVLVLMVATSAGAARRRLWKSHRDFQSTHVILGCALTVLLGAHVLATGRYTAGHGRRAVYVVVAAGGLAMLLRRRRGVESTRRGSAVHGLAFGRHSGLIAGVIAVTALALGTLISGRASVKLREPLLGRERSLPLYFDHGKHVAVNCLVCHHNYADGRGFDSCIHCHRGPRTDLVVGVEARFHDFCFNCHRNPEPRFKRHGPVSGCAACHVNHRGAATPPLA
jgi:hypothetical protein